MRQKGKFLALALSAVMALGVCMASACGNTTDDGGTTKPPAEQENPPAQKTPEVKSVAIKYNDAAVEGELSLALSVHTFELVPVVTADEGATYTVAWTSTEPDVATVEGDNTKATVTLNGGGETFIKAEAGAKSAQFVLTVDDDTPPAEYTITVVGGTAKNADGETITKATAGTQVTLEASTPEHKTLKEWTFDNEDVSLNGSTFTMPEGNITATATFTDTLYSLTLVGAKVTKAGEGEVPEGKLEGYTDEVETAESKILSYGIPYDTKVTIKAAKVAKNRIFVAWDYQVENNRVGEIGIDEYTFNMGDAESTKYTAIFSDFSSTVWTADTIKDGTVWGAGAKKIQNGGSDDDLQGLSGYTLSIPGGTKASTSYPETIEGSTMSTRDGRAMGKMIFKNHGDRAVTIEPYATYAGVLASPGNVTIQPNEVVVKYFNIGIGIFDPWWGVAVRADVEAGENILVDMVFGVSKDEFPNGDPYLNAGVGAEVVQIGDEKCGETWHNANGMSPNVYIIGEKGVYTFCGWGSRFGVANATRWDRVTIKNLPAYDAANPKITIYGRIINNMNNLNDPTAHYRIALGTNPDDPTKSSVNYDFTITQVGEIQTYKLELERTAEMENVYLFLEKPTLESTATTHGFALILQFTYNNMFGYEEA